MTRTMKRPILLIALVVVLACAWAGTMSPPSSVYSIDAVAKRYVDEGLRRALLTYGAARGLGAVLSVLQGTDVAFAPAGVGVKTSPGQILHPVTELVGQFADLMLIASVAFGVMDILTRIGSHWTISLAMTAAAAGWMLYYWRGGQAPPWLSKAVVIAILLRFGVAFVCVGNEVIYSAFMAKDYATSQQAIKASVDQIGASELPDSETTVPKSSRGRWLDWLPGWRNNSASAEAKGDRGIVDEMKEWIRHKGDVRAWLRKLASSADETIAHIVKLMVVFLLQTLVVPLLLYWVLLRSATTLLAQWPRAVL